MQELIRRSATLALSMAVAGSLFAQVSEKVKAEKLFIENQYDEVLQIADGLSKSRSLEKPDRVAVLELAIRSSLELGQLDNIDRYFKTLLKTDPFYEPAEDVVEERYINFYKKYEVLPSTSISISMALLNPRVVVKNSYSVYEDLDYANSDYSTSIWTHTAGTLCWYPGKHHRLSSGLSNPDLEFTRTIYSDSRDPLDQNYDVGPVVYREEAKTILLGLDYGFFPIRTSRFGLGFVFGGYGYYLREALGSVTVQYQLGTPQYEELSSSRRDRGTWERKLVGTYYHFGGEAFVNSRKIGVVAGLHYYKAFDTFNDPDYRYHDDELTYSFYYVDDDFYIDMITATFGVCYYLTYKVR